MHNTSNHESFDNSNSKMQHKHTALSRFLLAFSFIYSGVILIAYKSHYISYEVFHMIFNWQLLLVAIGLVTISKNGNKIGGYIMIFIGGSFLIPEFINIPFDTRQLFWPAILIGVGVIILLKGTKNWPHEAKLRFEKSDFTDIDMINDNHIFSGGEFHITSENFKGGKISAIMGGGKYNFRNVKLAPGIQILEVSLIFGGVELHVPSEWDVKIEVSSIFGGFSNKNMSYIRSTEATGQLIIRGSAIFGGGEVKRY